MVARIGKRHLPHRYLALLTVVVFAFFSHAVIAQERQGEQQNPTPRSQRENEQVSPPTTRPSSSQQRQQGGAARDQRMRQIEAQLRDALKELEDMRGGETGTTET